MDQHIQQALALHRSGQLAQATSLYQKILAIDPSNAGIRHLLGVAQYQAGNPMQAIETIAQAIALNANEPSFYFNLGKAHADTKHYAEAEVSYRKALKLNPQYAEAHANLGNVLEKLGRLDQAIASYRAALQLQPNDVTTYNNLGLALKRTGHYEESISCFRQALILKPNHAPTLNSMGNMLLGNGEIDQAIDYLDKALTAKPDAAETLLNLGNAFKERGDFASAKHYYQRAIAAQPDYATAYNNLAIVLKDEGNMALAKEAYQQALKIQPDYADAHSNLLLTMHYDDNIAHEEIFHCTEEWERRHASHIILKTNTPDPLPTKKLRVGYVSGDLRRHPVGFFIESVLSNHDQSAVEVYCYSNTHIEDELTAKLRKTTAQWRKVASLNDDDCATLIRSDQIDILVDLSGHTDKNRLLVFARKPAPIQTTWLGYCNTTGLKTMDYLLADECVIPHHTQQQFTEQVYRLPCSYLCYHPHDHATPIPALPVIEDHHVTFGCFNNLAKVTKETVAMWATIMQQLPNSKMLLKTHQLRDEATRRRYLALFLEQHIAPERLDLQGDYLTHHDHLAAYGKVDIALDTFPYNGVTTTCDALWMGVPVVTLTGDQFITRNSASILTNLGLSDLIATSPSQYVDIAVALAHNTQRLAELRSSMRQRFSLSPLGNPAQFVHNLEAAFRSMWLAWCSSQQ